VREFLTYRDRGAGQAPSIEADRYYSDGDPASVFLICNGPGLKGLDLSTLRQPGIMTAGVNNGLSVFRPDLWFSVDGPSRMLASGWLDTQVEAWCGTGKGDAHIKDEDKWANAGAPSPPVDDIYHAVAAEFPDMKHKRYTAEHPRLTGEGKSIAKARVEEWHTQWHSAKKVRECPNVVFAKLDTAFNAKDFWKRPTFNFGNHKDGGGGRTVMLFALKSLWVLGFRRIYIVGCDWFMSPNYAYGFDEQRTVRASHNNNTTFMRTTSLFTQMAAHMPEDLKIYNCNPRSFLFTFEHMDFDDAVKAATASLPSNEQTENRYVPGN